METGPAGCMDALKNSLVIFWRKNCIIGNNIFKIKNMEKVKVEQHCSMGMFWIAAWLFTIGFLHLTFWKGVLAVIVWPYYFGVYVSALLQQ